MPLLPMDTNLLGFRHAGADMGIFHLLAGWLSGPGYQGILSLGSTLSWLN